MKWSVKNKLSLITASCLVVGTFGLVASTTDVFKDSTSSITSVASEKKQAGVSRTITPKTLSIAKLMKQGLVQTYPGDPNLAKSAFRVDRLLSAPPKSLNLVAKDGHRFITVPFIMEDTSHHDGGYSVYKPNRFTLQDETGKEYESVDYVNRNEKAWKNTHQYFAPLRSQVDVVYQVPINKKTFVLFASSDAFAKTHTVKIEVD